MRRAATLLELIVTLAMFGIVLGLITQGGLAHARLQREFEADDAGTTAARQAVAILAHALDGVGAAALAAGASTDTSLELLARIGAGAGCAVNGGFLVPRGQSAAGPPGADYAATPAAGDRLLVLDDRARPAAWRARVVTSVSSNAGACGAARVPPAASWILALDSAVEASPAAPFLLQRRVRFALYRAGDGRWYLGMREWNAAAQRFNAVQPVAGPLGARRASPGRSGLLFEYYNSSGQPLGSPLADPRLAASITVTARPPDSTLAAAERTVALRGRP
ncbi:MAG: hypothetical protein KGL93_05550 [Gemmatimonadota bacterium]|nr:hypothetical protein [Gemmatimonadota bacterium]